MPVFDTMGLVAGCPETFFPVRFIIGKVSLKPDDFTIALKGQDVGGDPVEEPSIMADDHDTA